VTTLERQARLAWIGWGAYAQWTVCSCCGEWRYCRSKGGARYLCLDCFDQR
jgi:hypothetical protein